MSEIITKKVSDIKIIDVLYPRPEIIPALIQEYADNIEVLPPIDINQDGILIDGAHRLSAHKQNNLTEIKCIVTQTESESELFWLAVDKNKSHGHQLSKEAKRRIAVKECGGIKSDDEIIKRLSIPKRTYLRWTEGKKKQLKEERDEKILDLYLQCCTQQHIAEKLIMPKQTVSDVIDKLKSESGHLAQTGQNFKPQLYNIWSFAKNNNDNNHFGNMPRDIVENLLYYYTEPFDVVFDPFGGGGTTLDVCKSWYRRYFVSDIQPTEIALQKGVRPHDITTGLPEGLPKPNFIFLDPPYWKQAEKQYTELNSDFGNMSLDDFYSYFEVLFKQLYSKLTNGGHMAFIIQNTQWKNEDKHTEPHSHKLWNIAESVGYTFDNIIHVPYSTQQYNAQQVTYAKENKTLLELNRELVVFYK